MSLFNSFDRNVHFAELNTPLDDGQKAVMTPAQRKAAAMANLSGGGIGYFPGAGAGGLVTQITSRSTGVTLNTFSGAITLFAAAPSTTPTAFTVTNSQVGINDVIDVSVRSANAANTYIVSVTAVAAGSFQISLFSQAGTTSDSPVLNFNVIKGATT